MADDEVLAVHSMHRSTLRPFTVFGAERELALSAVLLCCLVAFSGLFSRSFLVMGLSLMLWFVLITALQALAKVDPLLSAVYRRHVRLRRTYEAHSRPSRSA